MKDIIKGKLALTIEMKAGDIWPIEYDSVSSLNIVNYTDGAIYVGEKNDFEYKNGVGEFLTISSSNGYNDYIFYSAGKHIIYIKADEDGCVSIINKAW